MEEKKLLNMENKYYTPEIEEFHIGYKYEITNGNEWVSKIFSKEDLKSFLYEKLENGINQKYIRTKYLDKEDIESLGWKYTAKSIDIWFKKEGVFERTSWTSKKATLHYNLEDKWLFIYLDDMGDETTIFTGKCPSINELRTIMKLLNIPL